MLLKNKITSLLSQGNERTQRAKKNVLASLVIKGLSLLVSLMIVPLTISYLDDTRYGIWLTLTSILGWIYFFDIGLGNGLRNKLAEAKARGEQTQARTYVSTTFALLSLVSAGLLVLFLIVNPFLDWTIILNTDATMARELSKTVLIVFAFFCLQFVFRLVSPILAADQKPAVSDLLSLCGNALALGIIFLLTMVTKGSLLGIGIVFSASPMVVFFVATIVMFRGKYKIYLPSIKFVNFNKTNDLLGLGVKFFVIQLAGLVLFTTTNIITAQIFGPAAVTPYSIAFKYLSVVTMVSIIVLSPFWTAYTDAYHKGEMAWIKRATRKLVGIWGLLCGALVVMVVVANWVYKVWVGDEIHVSTALNLAVALFVAICCWNNIFASFVNGVGKIKLQLYSSIVVGLVNIPLSIALAKWLNGVEGIVLSTCICLLVSAIWSPIQYLKIVNGTAKGIWNQ